MPIQDNYLRLPLASILINRPSRQRRELSVEDLKDDISKRGVLSPILVHQEPSGEFTLVFGERRLTASRELGLVDIPARLSNGLSPVELEIIELQENIKRTDLPWQDNVRAVERIHRLFLSLDEDWTQKETSRSVSLSEGIVSRYLMVAGRMEDEFISSAGTVNAAEAIIKRRDSREQGDALAEMLEGGIGLSPSHSVSEHSADETIRQVYVVPTDENGVVLAPSDKGTVDYSSRSDFVRLAPALPGFAFDSILCEDMTTWLPTYTGRKFSLIHVDLPYGVGLFSANGLTTGPSRSQMGQPEGQPYDDSPELYKDLVLSLAGNIDKIMSVSSHIMFWFSNKWDIESWTREAFARLSPSISWNRFPLIWLKSDNAGIAASPNYEPRHIYETCLVGSRGKRPIVRLVSDAYSAPTDKSIHVSAKPEPMLRHFMQMFVDENTTMFDPTCGSGSALRAAEDLGAKFVLGLERDAKMVELASRELKLARMKRKASGG